MKQNHFNSRNFQSFQKAYMIVYEVQGFWDPQPFIREIFKKNQQTANVIPITTFHLLHFISSDTLRAAILLALKEVSLPLLYFTDLSFLMICHLFPLVTDLFLKHYFRKAFFKILIVMLLEPSQCFIWNRGSCGFCVVCYPAHNWIIAL